MKKYNIYFAVIFFMFFGVCCGGGSKKDGGGLPKDPNEWEGLACGEVKLVCLNSQAVMQCFEESNEYHYKGCVIMDSCDEGYCDEKTGCAKRLKKEGGDCLKSGFCTANGVCTGLTYLDGAACDGGYTACHTGTTGKVYHVLCDQQTQSYKTQLCCEVSADKQCDKYDYDCSDPNKICAPKSAGAGGL